MKKIIFLMILILVGFQSWGQGDPIKPLKENGYSLNEVKTFIQGNSELSLNFRKEMLKIIQDGLSEAGEVLVLDEKNIPFVLGKIQYKNIQLKSGYINSRKVENKIEFFPNKKGFIGEVGVFVFDKTKIILFKTICLNLLKVKQKDVFLKKDKNFSLKRKEQTIVKKDTTITIINNFYYSNNSGKKTLTKKEKSTTPVVVKKIETIEYFPVFVYFPTTRHIGGGNRNYYKQPTVVGSILRGFGEGLAEGALYDGYNYSYGFYNYNYGYNYTHSYGYGYGSYHPRYTYSVYKRNKKN